MKIKASSWGGGGTIPFLALPTCRVGEARTQLMHVFPLPVNIAWHNARRAFPIGKPTVPHWRRCRGLGGGCGGGGALALHVTTPHRTPTVSLYS